MPTEPDFTDVTTHEKVPLPPTTAPVNLRGAFIFMAVLVLLLLIFEGASIRSNAEQMKPGWQRTMALAVGQPAGWVSETTGAHDAKQWFVAWARPSDATGPAARTSASAAGELGVVLITGDSMAQPLDQQLARAFTAADSKTEVIRDVHLGTSVSQPELFDWSDAAKETAQKWKPDAVVVLLGANEGFPFTLKDGTSAECCGDAWIAEYARRAEQMFAAWSRGDAGKVYWLTLPTPRSADRKEISDAVNRAIDLAAEGRDQSVRVVDLVEVLTPGERFRVAMNIDGRETVVREPDGVHMNKAGSAVALKALLAAMGEDFGDQVP